jgi:branched-chain amino acid transport system ATP-binding protein
MTSPLLEIKDLDLFYGQFQALAEVSLEVRQGEIVSIIGANGAGKSSLIRTIAGIEHPHAGKIYFAGHDITALEAHQVCDLGIGHIPEGRQIFPSLTTIENLAMGAMVPRARARSKQMMTEVFALFPRLAERKKQPAGTLSGGEQQMLAIGRCLMSCPELIMFDEPSLGLAPAVVKALLQTIQILNQRGLTILLVEQNVALSLKISQRAYVLENGRIALSGTGKDLLTNPRVRQSYLGML